MSDSLDYTEIQEGYLIMKIYTKYGDKGLTRLYGGVSISKSDIRVEAYGTMDELSSQLGETIAEMREYEELSFLVEECENIQQQLFDCGSDLATPNNLRPYKQREGDIQWLENRIDEYIPLLPELKSFIIPGGSKISGKLHISRTLTRRLERRIVEVIESGEAVNEINLKYVNRLSDYFFVIARLVNMKLGISDTLYKNSAKVFK